MYTCTKNTLATKGTRYDFKSCISIYFIFSYSTIFTTMLGSYYSLEKMALATGSQPSLETRMARTQLWECAFLYLSYTLTIIISYATTSTISKTTIYPINFIFQTTKIISNSIFCGSWSIKNPRGSISEPCLVLQQVLGASPFLFIH
jgi:hypothetical protein